MPQYTCGAQKSVLALVFEAGYLLFLCCVCTLISSLDNFKAVLLSPSPISRYGDQAGLP